MWKKNAEIFEQAYYEKGQICKVPITCCISPTRKYSSFVFPQHKSSAGTCTCWPLELSLISNRLSFANLWPLFRQVSLVDISCGFPHELYNSAARLLSSTTIQGNLFSFYISDLFDFRLLSPSSPTSSDGASRGQAAWQELPIFCYSN